MKQTFVVYRYWFVLIHPHEPNFRFFFARLGRASSELRSLRGDHRVKRCEAFECEEEDGRSWF